MTRYKSATVDEQPDSIVVHLDSGPARMRSVSVPVVVDIGRAGEVVGLEILNLSSYVGTSALDLLAEGRTHSIDERLSYSYDSECDAFYLRLRMADAPTQKAVQGVLELDINSRIVGIRAHWELP